MFRGALFAGRLFAGALFGAQEVVTREAQRAAGGRKVRKILLERIETLEDLVEAVEQVVHEEPKVKAELRKAKKVKPKLVQPTRSNAQAWITYFELVIAAFRDQERAREALAELEQSLKLLNALLLRQEIAEYLQKEQDESMFMLFMLLGASEWA